MKEKIALIKRRWFNIQNHPHITAEIEQYIDDCETKYGMINGVYYDGTDYYEPYEESEINVIMKQEPITVTVSFLNQFENPNPPLIKYKAYPIDKDANSILIYIDDEEHDKIINNLTKKTKNESSKRIHEQSLRNLMEEENEYWSVETEPNTLLDFEIKGNNLKKIKKLKTGKINKRLNNRIFKLNSANTRILESYGDIDDIIIDTAIRNDFNAIKYQNDLYLLDNYETSNIQQINYKKELLKAASGGVSLAKDIIDEHPEISTYLMKEYEYLVPEFKGYGEVIAWIRETYPNITIEMEHIDMNIIRETLNQLHALSMRYPEASKLIKYIGTFIHDSKKRYNFGFRFAHTNLKTGEIGLNPDHYEFSPEDFQEKADKAVETCFHPRGSNNYGYVITHEFGHLVETVLRTNTRTKKVTEQFIYRDNKPDEKLCEYALIDTQADKDGNIPKDFSEWFAEAFASDYYTPDEYKHPLTKKTREFLDIIWKPKNSRNELLRGRFH